jgi:hypothetical protein
VTSAPGSDRGAGPAKRGLAGCLERRGTRRLIGSAGAIGAFLWFAFDNKQEVTIDWWIAEVRARLVYVILVAFALGFVTSRLLARRGRRKE